jgi:hypothetical protein
LTTLGCGRLLDAMKILLAIEKTKIDVPTATAEWHGYIARLQRIADILPDIETFGEGCWLLTSENSLLLLETALYNTERWKYPYRIGFLSPGLDIEIWRRDPKDNPIPT